MSEPKKVAIFMGNNPAPKLPQQDYEHLVVHYNFGGLVTAPDVMFYKDKLEECLQQSEFDLYGFFGGNHSFSSESAVTDIVDYFNSHEEAGVVYCDLKINYPTFVGDVYFHSEDVPNAPFFIRDSCVHGLSFDMSDNPLQEALRSLVQAGNPLFHIATPLLTVTA